VIRKPSAVTGYVRYRGLTRGIKHRAGLFAPWIRKIVRVGDNSDRCARHCTRRRAGRRPVQTAGFPHQGWQWSGRRGSEPFRLTRFGSTPRRLGLAAWASPPGPRRLGLAAWASPAAVTPRRGAQPHRWGRQRQPRTPPAAGQASERRIARPGTIETPSSDLRCGTAGTRRPPAPRQVRGRASSAAAARPSFRFASAMWQNGNA
jgi:hypothetical protein